MSRGLTFAALCALPLAMSSAASAQSFIEVTGGPAAVVSGFVGAPVSITQPYTPRPSEARELSLLVDDSEVAVPPAPVAINNAVSPQPSTPALFASNDRGAGRHSLTVSNVRGFYEQE